MVTVSGWWLATGILAIATIFFAAKNGKGTGQFMDLSPIFGFITFLMGVIAIMALWLIKGCVE